MSIIKATISKTGCVRHAVVLRSAGGPTPSDQPGSESLDFAALQAVMQWRYSPTLLDGMPVEVVMTVTTQFQLR